jgi:hypothetical protein
MNRAGLHAAFTMHSGLRSVFVSPNKCEAVRSRVDPLILVCDCWLLRLQRVCDQIPQTKHAWICIGQVRFRLIWTQPPWSQSGTEVLMASGTADADQVWRQYCFSNNCSHRNQLDRGQWGSSSVFAPESTFGFCCAINGDFCNNGAVV